MKPFFSCLLKIGHSILISEELLNKLYMENDQIDLWDFFKHNFKHVKNCPVGIQKEASVALCRGPWGFLRGLQRISILCCFLYFLC